MKITWEVNDGYVGGSRPQYSNIDENEIMDCGDVDSAMDCIFDLIQEDFENNIRWSLSDYDYIKEKVKKLLKEK